MKFTNTLPYLAMLVSLAAANLSAAGKLISVLEASEDNKDIVSVESGVTTGLATGAWNEFEPTQSPDGTTIIFTSDQTGLRQLNRMSADGSNPTNISNNPAEEFDASFSPDGTKVVFVSRSEQPGAGGIWLMGAGGQDRERLVADNVASIQSHPRWSPDGQSVLFESFFIAESLRSLHVIGADGSSRRNLVSISGFETYSGSWSEDSANVAFYYTTSNDERGVARAGVNGQDFSFLAVHPEGAGPSGYGAPCWADDDQKIVFETDVDGNSEIYVMDADGDNETNLTNNAASDRNPVWLADDSQLLFISDRSGNDDIFAMSIDGSGPMNLTNSPGADSNPHPAADDAPLNPVISEGGIVLANLAPKVSTISPLSIISVFGNGFTKAQVFFPSLDDGGKIATTLGGVCLEMNGERLPLFAATPTQINAQASAAELLGPASFTVISDCDGAAALTSAPLTIEPGRNITSAAQSATVESATPAFFLYQPVVDGGFIAARFNADNVAVAPDGMFNDQFGPSQPAQPGDIIVLYGTGWGATEPSLTAGELATEAAEVLSDADPSVLFGDAVLSSDNVLYVGVTPGAAGLYQLTIIVPENAQPGDNQVVLRVYGKQSPFGPVVPVVIP